MRVQNFILNEGYDVIYPSWTKDRANKRRRLWPRMRMVSNFLSHDCQFSYHLEKKYEVDNFSESGHDVHSSSRRSTYIEAGMENENLHLILTRR